VTVHAAPSTNAPPALAQRIQLLDAEIGAHDQARRELIDQAAPRLIAERRIGYITAAEFYLAWSHPGRCHSEAAFARHGGTSPVPVHSASLIALGRRSLRERVGFEPASNTSLSLRPAADARAGPPSSSTANRCASRTVREICVGRPSWPPAGEDAGRRPNYSIRRPEIARAMTTCWISDVPSKIVWFRVSESAQAVWCCLMPLTRRDSLSHPAW
jgi:hypothetical protein